ncbi:MAG: Smr/MutS family protein [Proteobacteria bacterium]|nr:Smr/MutS family protein [Pseudomonadota bacterium]
MRKPPPKKPKRPAVTPEEQAMFLAALDGVTPLGARDRIALPPAPPSVVKVVTLPPTVKLAVEGNGQQYTARAPGVSLSQVAELRSGRVRFDKTLDLHGELVEPALAHLREFLFQASREGWRTILVIHGKGLHSEHGAPLREAVHHELLGACSGFVHALATAAPSDGGEGATCVVLRGGR